MTANFPGIEIEANSSNELWPLSEIVPNKSRFPCCLVWTPLPVVSWIAPFIGHIGICKEDGTIYDFSGSNLVNVDDFTFGKVARYFQLDITQCCLPANLSSHNCKERYKHHEFGAAISWDDALQTSVHQYEHKSYNLMTCNSHSFVANSLNRLGFGGSVSWNVINVATLVLWRGKWVDCMSVLKSFLPFVLVLCVGIYTAGWPFLIGHLSFSLLLIIWFVFGTYFDIVDS